VGSLVYDDHGVGFSMKSTSIAGFVPGCTATFQGAGTSNLGDVVFTATATDNGEPGTSDTFTIAATGYSGNSGTLGGGNIQVHGTCP
jgi:hypothetical protein